MHTDGLLISYAHVSSLKGELGDGLAVELGKAADRDRTARVLDSVTCSDLLHEVFGKTGDGHHARSALGFAQLPTGAAVEVEAIFEIKA